MSDKLKMLLIALLIIVIGILIDQVTKALVVKHIFTGVYDSYGRPINQDVQVIQHFFKLSYAENTGGGWSIFEGKLWFFYTVTILALFAFGYFMKDFDLKQYPLYSVALILMITGTIGNFIDRIIHKYVVDFLDFIIFGYDFPMFNVADSCLTIGVAGLLVAVLLHKSPV
ncbi:MAG: signal peptidase II [Bacilli bacterium]